MLSINTNLSSLIAQSSMKQSTNKLNLAIERMSTGFKVNHASDNAANYSIATNMTTKINSYMVAEDNIAAGMDFVALASDVISLMQEQACRLQALSILARNEVHSSQSLNGINLEASAIISEIMKLYSTAEYDGISLFTNNVTDDLSVDSYFINNPIAYSDEAIKAMTTLTKAIDETSLVSGGTYSISTLDELVALANYVNNGNDTTGMTFVLGADIDLSPISNWIPIGNGTTGDEKYFRGTFDGNGHVIKNLIINNETESYQGLFGRTQNATIKNVGVEGGSVKGNTYVGGLIGSISGYTFHGINIVENCYANVSVQGNGFVGGLCGEATIGPPCTIEINNCYSMGDVTAKGNSVGGFIGQGSCTINNCYATGNVISEGENVGGFVGYCNDTINNCYATGNVTGGIYVGGLAGRCGAVSSSYSTGDVSSRGIYVGGLIGQANGDVANSYALGAVKGGSNVGGLFGTYLSSVVNCYSTGNVVGSSGGTALTNSSDWDGTYYTHDYGEASCLGNKTLTENSVTATKPFLLQIGVNGDSSCQLEFGINFDYDFSKLTSELETEETFNNITDFINQLNEKSTVLGSISNRLENILLSVTNQYENLVSSRSTIRDADIAEVSASYIQQQILQQASATLLATANQSPSIALQLI